MKISNPLNSNSGTENSAFKQVEFGEGFGKEAVIGSRVMTVVRSIAMVKNLPNYQEYRRNYEEYNRATQASSAEQVTVSPNLNQHQGTSVSQAVQVNVAPIEPAIPAAETAQALSNVMPLRPEANPLFAESTEPTVVPELTVDSAREEVERARDAA